MKFNNKIDRSRNDGNFNILKNILINILRSRQLSQTLSYSSKHNAHFKYYRFLMPWICEFLVLGQCTFWLTNIIIKRLWLQLWLQISKTWNFCVYLNKIILFRKVSSILYVVHTSLQHVPGVNPQTFTCGYTFLTQLMKNPDRVEVYWNLDLRMEGALVKIHLIYLVTILYS